VALGSRGAQGARCARDLGVGLGLAVMACGLLGLLRSAGVPSASAAPAPSVSERNEAAPSAPAPAPPTGGELPSTVASVASYEIRATLDPVEHLIRGTAVVRWTNTSRLPQSELYWHLYLNAYEHERTVFMRSKQSEGFRGAGRPSQWGHVKVERMFVRELERDVWPGEDAHSPDEADDRTDVRVPLPAPVEPGASLTIELAWESRLPGLVLRTGFVGSFHMAGQWFPKLARLEPDGRWAHFPFERLSEFYADFGDYDVTLDVPEPFLVGATGRLDWEKREAGRAIRRFVQPSVHDFAFAAWDQFRELEEPASADGVRMRCLFPPGEEASARRELESARFGLSHFAKAYGAYPYATLTLVHPPAEAAEAGGMEYPTLITTGSWWLLERMGARTLEQVTVHELAHQWFYGLVATNEREWPFLDEGLASFAEGEALETRYPGSSALQLLGLRIGLPAASRVWGLKVWDDDIVAQPAASFATGLDYGGLVYGKTSTLLTTLGRVWGEERLKAALGAYARRFRFAHPGPEDLLTVMRAEVGEQAAAQLRAGLFERGWVDYQIAEVGEAAADPAGSRRSSVLVRRLGTLVFPVEVELVAKDGTRQRVSWDGQGDHVRLEHRGSSPLVAAVVDPEHRVLMDRDLSNNARRAESGGLGRAWAPRVLGHAAFAVELLLAALGP
jgi:hypothetical protein